MNFLVIFYCLIFVIGLTVIAWMRRYRTRYESFIKPPKALPVRDPYVPENYTAYGPEQVIWNACEPLAQPVGSVECVAYSLRSLLASPPLDAKFTPSIPELFAQINARDDQRNSDQGLNPIGAMKFLEQERFIGRAGFLTNLLRRCGFRHSFFNFNSAAEIKRYVRAYAPVIAGIPVFSTPRIDDGCLYAMEGDLAFYHSILIYGVDETRVCPDGSVGAFRVRWHIDLFGETDGWLAYALAERIVVHNWSYGWRD